MKRSIAGTAERARASGVPRSPLARRGWRRGAAWSKGGRGGRGGGGAAIAVVEGDGERLKFNPCANVSRDAIAAIYASAKLPPHPLVASGFQSVGCMPCTSRTAVGEDERAGRWRGRPKSECGIHTTANS